MMQVVCHGLGAGAGARPSPWLADKAAAARARAAANEDDLAAIFALDADLDGAAQTREAAIALRYTGRRRGGL